MPPQLEEGFRITISEENGGYKVRVESSLGSEERVMEANFENLAYYLMLRELRGSLQPGIVIDKTLSEGYIKKFGKELFDTLFTKEMKEIFGKCFAHCMLKGKTLRILFESDSLKIHQIPWEIMYYKEEKIFLGNSPYVTFSRSIPDAPATSRGTVKLPMKLLVLVSSPLDLPDEVYKIDIGEIERLIGAPLEGLKSQGRIIVEFSDDTRFDKVRNRVREGWNIIHFVGHGIYDGKKTSILIENNERNQYLLSAERVPDLFESEKRPNLILFSACESAQVPLEIHSGIPFILLKRGFPAVIAMQYSVLVEVADAFAKCLYENLGKLSLDKAVSEARMVIYQKYGEDNIFWFTPVLYVCGLNHFLDLEKNIVPGPQREEKRVDFLTNLPRAKIFFGRKKYRLLIEEIFFEKKRRVLLLTGIGGIGKSSLAREFAHRSREKYKAILSKKVTADFSLKSFLGEIGEFLSVNGDKSIEEIVDSDLSIKGKLECLCSSLNIDAYLIILDGFEEVLENSEIKSEDMKILLDAFLNGHHKSNVILTSRFPLEEYEMDTVDIGDLSKQSCWRILKEGGADLDWKEITYIYERMGGNPKYYNLLSSLLKKMGKENLLKAVKKAKKDIDAWLLDKLFDLIPNERKILEKVSVFRIPFKRSALELANCTSEIVETLLGLSLLKFDERYFVHSIVRDYCVDRMTKRERKSAHELSAKYYLQERKDFEKLLELHYHLLKAGRFEDAARIVFNVLDVLITQGYMKLAFRLNLSASWGTSQKTKSMVYHNVGVIFQQRGEYTKAIKYYNKSLKISKKLHSAKNIASTYHQIGTIHQLKAEYEKAIEYFNRSLEIKERIRDIEGIAGTLAHLGIVHQSRGEYTKAIKYYNKSLKISETLRKVGDIARTYHQIGIIHQSRGEYTKAIEYFDKSLKISEKLNDLRNIASTYHQIGTIHQLKGEYKKAIEYFDKSLEIQERIHDVEGIATICNNIGVIYQLIGEHKKAIEYFNKSLEIKERIRDIEGIASTYCNIAIIHQSRGEYEKAIEYFNKGLEISEKLNDVESIAITCGNIGTIYGSRGEHEKAIEYFDKSLKISEKLHDLAGIATICMNLGNVYQDEGEYEKAMEHYNKSLRISEKLNDMRGISLTYYNFGTIHQLKGEHEKAIEYFNKGLKISEKLNDAEAFARTYYNIGIIHQSRGEYEKAIEYFNKGLEISEKLNDVENVATAYYTLSTIHSFKGEYEKAIEYFNKGLEISEKLNDVRDIAKKYYQIGIVHQFKGEYEKAIEYLNKGLEVFEKLSNEEGISNIHHNFGIIYHLRGEYKKAIKHFNKSLEIKEKLHDKIGIAFIYGDLGGLYIEKQDYEKALKLLLSAHDIFFSLQLPHVSLIEGLIVRIRHQIGEIQFRKLWEKITQDEDS